MIVAAISTMMEKLREEFSANLQEMDREFTKLQSDVDNLRD